MLSRSLCGPGGDDSRRGWGIDAHEVGSLRLQLAGCGATGALTGLRKPGKFVGREAVRPEGGHRVGGIR